MRGLLTRNSLVCSLVISLIIWACVVGKLSGIHSTKVQLDPELIAETWEFIGSSLPDSGSFAWCPEKKVYIIVYYHKNPKPNEVPEIVRIIFNIGRQRIDGIVWEEKDITWLYERFCQETWTQRLPDPVE